MPMLEVRWLGNSCVEVVSFRRILIDPCYTVEPEAPADIILVTHEHSDHINPEHLAKARKPETRVYAPKSTLEAYGIQGTPVRGGDEFEGVKAFSVECWKAAECIAYLADGVLHAGDAADFPSTRAVVAFTACYPEYYSRYVESMLKVRPRLVVPVHYSPEKHMDRALGLVEELRRAGLEARLLKPGEKLKLSGVLD